jgi:hypothetical protein
LQIFLGYSLGNVQEFLRDQAFEFAEWLLHENLAHFFSPRGIAFAQNQLATLLEEGPRGIRYFLPQFFLTLQVG